MSTMTQAVEGDVDFGEEMVVDGMLDPFLTDYIAGDVASEERRQEVSGTGETVPPVPLVGLPPRASPPRTWATSAKRG